MHQRFDQDFPRDFKTRFCRVNDDGENGIAFKHADAIVHAPRTALQF
jgi:hypothetical protein